MDNINTFCFDLERILVDAPRSKHYQNGQKKIAKFVKIPKLNKNWEKDKNMFTLFWYRAARTIDAKK